MLHIAAAVWLVGFAAVMLYDLLRYAFVQTRMISQCKYIRTENCGGRDIDVYSSSSVGSPVLLGIVSPLIVLPERKTSEEELRLILGHELIHYKNKDLLKIIFYVLISDLFWYDPFRVYFLNQFRFFIECACDEELTRSMAAAEKKKYCTMLINFSGKAVQSSFAVPLTSSAKILKRRMDIMFSSNKKSKLSKAAVAILTVILLSAAAVFAFSFKVSAGGASAPVRIVEVFSEKQYPVSGNVLISDVGTKVTLNDSFFPNDRAYKISASDGVLSGISSANGQVLLISEEDGGGWHLTKGQTISISLGIDLTADYSDNVKEHIALGYYSADGTDFAEIFDGFVTSDGLELSFEAPSEGEYYFYLLNCSAGLENYTEIRITV